MPGLLTVLIIFLLIGGILKFTFSMVRLSLKLAFWILGLIFGVFGWLFHLSLMTLLGILVVAVPVYLLSRRR